MADTPSPRSVDGTMPLRLPTAGLDRRTLAIAGIVVLGLLMSLLDTTIVNVALDRLAEDLDAPLVTIQWVSTGYLLSLAVMIPLSGWATERFGARRIWLWSIVLFGSGSALCGLSDSVGELIAFRLLQGIGGGMLLPVGFTLVTQAAGPKHAGTVLSLVGVPMLLGPICGPILGGLIVDNVSWHWIFFVNVPIAVVAVILAARVLDADTDRRQPVRLDTLGAVLACGGLVSVVFGLSETESGGGLSRPEALVPVLAGLALLALFVLHARRASPPLIHVRLFADPVVSSAAAVTFLLAIALFGALLLLPLYYQLDRGESALSAGLLIAPQGIGAAAALPISGRLTDRLGGGPVVLAGAVIATLATLPWAFVAADTPYPLLAAVLFVRGIGLGASLQPASAAALAVLTRDQVPEATAALNTMRQVGASVGTALAAVLLERQSRAATGGSGGGESVLQRLASQERHAIEAPLADAFGHAFAWITVATGSAIVVGGLLWISEARAGQVRRGASRLRRLDPGRAADADT